MNRALNYLSLAKKARRIELGEEPVGAAARAQKACLLVVAADASGHTLRRAQSFVNGTGGQVVSVPFSKTMMGQAVGRQELALAAFTDPALALAFLKALDQPEKYRPALQALENRANRVLSRQAEARAHQRNVRTGRVRKSTDK